MSNDLEEVLSKQVAALEAKIIELKKALESKDEEISNLKSQVLRITSLHEKSYKCCADLRNHCDSLKIQLSEKIQSSCKKSVDVEVQVNPADLQKGSTNGEDWKDGANSISISELVKSAAQQAISEQGYTYDDESKYYYHHSTGYYYNAESGLYYDPKTGIYFYYNHETGNYDFHSQVEPNLQKSHENEEKLTRNSKHDKKKITSDDDNESVSSLEEGEIVTDDEDLKDQDDVMQCDDPHDIDLTDDEQEAAAAWPPCLRIMVTKSFQPNQIGSLFIITHPGGTIGSKDNCDIHISNAQPLHAFINFDEDLQTYVIRNACRDSTITVNDQQLIYVDTEDNEEKSSWLPIKHADVVEIFDASDPDQGTQLLIHTHISNDTCDECEPGVVKAAIQKTQLETKQAVIVIMSKEEKEAERRRQLKNIKSKYGLKNDGYVINKDATDITRKGYVDKAKERQQVIGSDNPYEKDSIPSSTDVAISSCNKGFKMLQNMGWQEGKGLGKAESGRHDPVNVDVKCGRKGLGAEPKGFNLPPPTKSESNKAKIWQKTRNRFQQIESDQTLDDDDADT